MSLGSAAQNIIYKIVKTLLALYIFFTKML